MLNSPTVNCVFLIRSLDVGGAERQLGELARGLHLAGIRVTVITFYPGGAFHALLESSGVSVVSAYKKGRWEIVGFLRRLVRLVKAERPDVLYSFLPGANLLAVGIRYFARPRLVVWGVRASSLDLSSYGWLIRLESFLCRLCARLADVIVCNSHVGLEHHVAQGYPARKMHVITNGIDCSVFKFDPVERKRVRAEWNVQEDDMLIGLVARIDPMKGHGDFLAAAALLAPELPRLRFVCVGSGPSEQTNALHAMAENLGVADRVIWAGQRTDVSSVYSALDVVLSASRFGEGFSNSVAEAMACERVCIVTDVGDSRSMVAAFGRVVQPRDAASLAAAIKSIVSLSATDRAQLGRAARRRVERVFAIPRMVDETARLLGIPLPRPVCISVAAAAE